MKCAITTLDIHRDVLIAIGMAKSKIHEHLMKI